MSSRFGRKIIFARSNYDKLNSISMVTVIEKNYVQESILGRTHDERVS